VGVDFTVFSDLVTVVVLEGNVGGTANLVSRASGGVVNSNLVEGVGPEGQASLEVEVAPAGLNVKFKRSGGLHVGAVAGGDVNNTNEVSLLEVTVLSNNDGSGISGGVGLVAPHGTGGGVLNANLLVDVLAPFVGGNVSAQGPFNSLTVRISLVLNVSDCWVSKDASGPVASSVGGGSDGRGLFANLTIGDLDHVASANLGHAIDGKNLLVVLVLDDLVVVEALSVDDFVSLFVEDLNVGVQSSAVVHASGGSLEQNVESQSVILSEVNAVDSGLESELGTASLLPLE